MFIYLQILKGTCTFYKKLSVPSDETFWRYEWGGHIIFSQGSSTNKGVCIFFSLGLDVLMSRSFLSTNGRYIVIVSIIRDMSSL